MGVERITAMIDRESNSVLRIFGTPLELLSKAKSDLRPRINALVRGRQRDARLGCSKCKEAWLCCRAR
jgi:hypothetical protein